MYKRLDIPDGNDVISDIFTEQPNLDNYVRYMNLINTQIRGSIICMYVIDGFCNLFTKEGESQVWWYKFDSSKSYMDYLIDEKRQAEGNYNYDPNLVQKEYPILYKPDWTLKFVNRDLTTEDRLEIEDAYLVKCYNPDDNPDD